MTYSKSSGLRLGDGSYNNLPEEYVYSAEVMDPSTNNTNGAGSRVGSASMAVGVSEVLSSYNVPNPIDFVKGLWGSWTNNEKLIAKFDSQFRTLGNGKFELNDVLGLPVNWGYLVKGFIADKLSGNKPKEEGTKLGNWKRPKYGTEEWVKYMKEQYPSYEPQGSPDKDVKKYGEVIKDIIETVKKGGSYGEAR